MNLSATTSPTLILPPRYTEDSVSLWRAALAMGWHVERLKSWQPPDSLHGKHVVIYGEPLFGAAVAEVLGYTLLDPPIDWVIRLSADMLRRQIRLSTLAEAVGLQEHCFIKPIADKYFPAKVYEPGSQIPGADLLDSQTLVIIAEPVVWTSEFRCFVLDGKVATSSVYARNGELAQSEDGSWPISNEEEIAVSEFCRRLLDESGSVLPRAVVVDVGQIEGRGWAVVELNACWASGLYGCDPVQVLKVIQGACIANEAS